MTEHSERDAARAELVRLLRGLDFYRDWQISLRIRAKGTISDEDLNEIVAPGSFFLEVFDKTTGKGFTHVLKDVQRWYARASSDLNRFSTLGDAASSREVRQFLGDFRTEVGFDFYAEAGLLKKTANRVLKRRRIAREDEYDILKELEHDLSQAILGADELATVSNLLREFENR